MKEHSCSSEEGENGIPERQATPVGMFKLTNICPTMVLLSSTGARKSGLYVKVTGEHQRTLKD